MTDAAPSSKVQNVAPVTNLINLPARHGLDADPLTPTHPRPTQEIRIVIAQNQTICRESLRTFLQTGDPAFKVVGGCPGEDALSLIRKMKPDVLLLAGCVPQRESLEMLHQLKESKEDVKVMLLCPGVSKEETVRFLQLGVRGMVLETDPTASLFEGIRKVARGEYWLGTDGITTLVQSLFDLGKSKGTQKNKYGLTPRESEIILAVLEGYSNPEIAAHFSLSEQTVKHHLSHIFDKLGVYSRLELALFAVNHGINSE